MRLRLIFYLFAAIVLPCFSSTEAQARVTPTTTITLGYDGPIRDRVGQNNLARTPDGLLDGTFTVTLNAGSGNRTVTQLQLLNSAGGVWNTLGEDGFWTLGVANGWDAALVNESNDAVNLAVADGGGFQIFAANVQNRMFLEGTVFTLSATFSDGSTATGTMAIAALPAMPVVAIAATTANAVEGGVGGAFSVARTGSTTSALTVNYTVAGTAVAGTNYAALSGSVVITAGSFTAAIAIVPVENSIAEGDKTVVVTLGANAAYLVGSPPSATVTVHDNDVPATPSIALRFDGLLRDRVGQNNLSRNPDGHLDGTFTVTLNAGSGSRTVTQLQLLNSAGGVWNTQGGDGFWTLGVANGWDAALVNGNNDAVNLAVADGGEFQVFAADFQNQMFFIGSVFTLTATFSDGSTSTANMTIAALPAMAVATIAATTANAVEGGASGAFTVTRTGSTTSALTVNYTVAGTAVAGTNYTALNGSVVIAVGSLTAVIAVVPVENSIAEGDKTVVVTLGANAAYSVGSPSNATVTVHDNDAPPVTAVVTIAATTANAVEGGASGAFTVARTGSTTSTLTVNYTVAGTAVAGTNYTALSGSVVIAVGSLTAAITVVPVENSFAEGNKTVVVTLGTNAAYSVGSPSSATVTVNDNDVPPVSATIAMGFDGLLRDRVGQNNLARNPDGHLDGTFTVTLNAGSGNRTVTQLELSNSSGGVWNTQGGDGFWTLGVANGLDATLVNGNNDAVNLAVADGGGFQVFASDYQNRMFLEGTVFTLKATFSDGSTATGNMSIAGPSAVTIAASTANAVEGGNGGAFTIARTGSTASALTVNYTVGGTAVAGTNYTALSGSSVIAAGSFTATIAVVPVENSLAEGDKTVVVTLGTNAAYSVGSPSSATVTVHDNEAPVGPSLTSTPGIVSPGGTLTVSWSGIASPTNKDWIGLFAAGAGDSSFPAWIYVSCTQTAGSASASGACPFGVPSSLANGIYELRLFSNGQTIRLATSLPFSVTPLDTNILITSPARSVAGAPKVATISIDRQECNSVFSIPYIQTGNVLTVNAVTRTIPNGGGVVFVLSNNLTGQLVQLSLSPPFSATFTGLAKGEYRLDSYIVDPSSNIVAGELNHDYATNIGIGDIYVAIGDSITEGYDGVAYNTSAYTNWLQAPIASNDSRNFPQCGISSGFYQDHWQEVSHHITLNNKLEAFFGYPIFILNEGVAGGTTNGYLTRMNNAQWQNRIAKLKPNKWLVHLGTNDGGGSTTFQNSMQSLVNILKGSYAANGRDIILAVPQNGPSWQPYIGSLISANGLTSGPDFNSFYSNNTNPPLVMGVHPNIPGHEQMARLWALSILSPRNVAVQQLPGGPLSVSWENLQQLEPTIAGYKVYYGANPGSLTSVINVGHVTTALFNVPSAGPQTYYFAVQGYDNDAHVPNVTSVSSPVAITVGN